MEARGSDTESEISKVKKHIKPPKHKIKRQHNADKYKKFLGNKEKGQGFADKRKRKMKYEYMKLVQKKGHAQEHRKAVGRIYAGDDSPAADVPQHTHRAKGPHQVSKLEAAKLCHDKKKQDSKIRKQEMRQQKAARETALSQYKQNKLNQHRKLSKKTVRGQPVMKNQIEALLEKIQKQSAR